MISQIINEKKLQEIIHSMPEPSKPQNHPYRNCKSAFPKRRQEIKKNNEEIALEGASITEKSLIRQF